MDINAVNSLISTVVGATVALLANELVHRHRINEATREVKRAAYSNFLSLMDTLPYRIQNIHARKSPLSHRAKAIRAVEDPTATDLAQTIDLLAEALDEGNTFRGLVIEITKLMADIHLVGSAKVIKATQSLEKKLASDLELLRDTEKTATVVSAARQDIVDAMRLDLGSSGGSDRNQTQTWKLFRH